MLYSRNSLKDRTRTYKECRFIHLTGTKTIYTQKPKASSSYNTKQSEKKSNKSKGPVNISNRFAPLEETEDEEAEKQVNKNPCQTSLSVLSTNKTFVVLAREGLDVW